MPNETSESSFLAKVKELNKHFLNTLNRVHQESPHYDFRLELSNYAKNYEQIHNSHLKNQPTSSELSTTKESGASLGFNFDLLSEVKNELESLKVAFNGGEEESITRPRTNHISWHEYFMSVAQLAAKRSKDPSTQVGACIVNTQNKIIATGYNGMPNGVQDNLIPWNKEGEYLATKYAYVVHAELNAILNCVLTNQTGCRLYVSLFPCNECAKAIIQSGIRHVVFLSDKHKEKETTKASKIMFQMAGVLCEQYSSLLSK